MKLYKYNKYKIKYLQLKKNKHSGGEHKCTYKTYYVFNNFIDDIASCKISDRKYCCIKNTWGCSFNMMNNYIFAENVEGDTTQIEVCSG